MQQEKKEEKKKEIRETFEPITNAADVTNQ
jgi:hypothetical protein